MTSTPIASIRPARDADADAIAAIYNQGIASRAATFETVARTAADLLPRIRDTRWPLLVACDRDGRVSAWAGLGEYRARACYAGIAEFSIYVDAAARGGGIGRRLLAALLEAARAAGCWKLVSRVFPENAASRALCRAGGFREVGVYERHARLDGRWRDVVIVERLLDDH